MTKARLRLVGVAFLALLGLLIWLSLALYDKQFTPVAMVTLHSDSVGNEMHPGGQVLVRGVQVGEVRSISAEGSGAVLKLAIQPGMVSKLPANVTAVMVPTTLFGERSVDLILPPTPAPARLDNGSVIQQDRSKDAIEVETVLNNLLPELTAVQPQHLSVTLTAIAQALQGRGTKLGRTLVQLNAYLHRFLPNLPALDNDIRELVQVTRTYNQAVPDIVRALNDFTVVNNTLVQQEANLTALLSTLTQSDQDLNTFLRQNQGNIIGLSAHGLATLKTLARYSREFPCVLRELDRFEPDINRVLGAGTSQPGLHVHVNVLEPLGTAQAPLGNYLPGKDTPFYGDDLGPHCYPIPFRGIPLNDGASPATARSSSARTSAAGRIPAAASSTTALDSSLPGGSLPGGLSLANSPQENEFVNEISAPALRVPPGSLPGWSSMLVGPLYRGRQVQLR
jgi:phospholipid/cholesterol/gamma-HCH transport system substrate-binding protein